jgi:hypothetical protein
MSVYETKEWVEDLPKFTALLKDINTPVSSFGEEIVIWFGKPKLERFDPYAALYRNVCESEKDGMASNPANWGSVLPRLEELHNMCMASRYNWARIISSESIAHRWADIDIHLGKKEYRNKWMQAYDDSCRYATMGSASDKRYLKFVDSSMYWKAHALARVGEYEDAKEIYCKIFKRKGARYGAISPAFKTKLRIAKEICKGTRNMPGQPKMNDSKKD